MSALYDWVPISRGQPLLAGAVMAGRTSTDGDVYVGRNAAGEAGKVNLQNGSMRSIWCHAGGESDHAELLVPRAGSTVEWRPYKHHEPVPDGAVWAGVTRSDGKGGVFVARETKHGACGKVNLTDDTGVLNNLWVHGHWTARKEGEILLVRGPTYAGIPAPAMPMPSAPPIAVPVAIPTPVGGWNPNAMCDGIRAEERVLYLQQNQGMTIEAARQQVMREFPAQFAGAAAWNPNANCDGIRAEERVLYLQQNQGMSIDAARQQIMREFPAQFSGALGVRPTGGAPMMPIGAGGYSGGSWNPNAMCDGKRAEERAQWLQQNKGMTVEASRRQIMSEFPAQFPSAPVAGGGVGTALAIGAAAVGAALIGGAVASAVHHHSGPHWNPNAMCDGSRAEERATWLHQNKGMSMEAAKQQIMREFPAQFGGGMAHGPRWNANAMCDGSRADERANWLQQNKGMSLDAARQQVMREFPAAFHH